MYTLHKDNTFLDLVYQQVNTVLKNNIPLSTLNVNRKILHKVK